MMKIGRLAASAIAALSALASHGVMAQDLTPQNFNVMGTWNNLNPYKNFEEPFWTKTLPENSAGKLTATLRSMTELNVKGYETLALLKQGVFNFGHATIAYVTGNVPQMEGIDLAAVATDMEASRRNAEAFKDGVNKHLNEREGVRIIALYPFSSQYIFCRNEIAGLADLKGLKIRTSSATHADFIEGAGAVNVTIPFAEVVPALQNGVVDCAVTGSMSAYGGQWQEVVKSVYVLPINMGLSAMFVSNQYWDGLEQTTRDFMAEQIAEWEDTAWAGLAAEDAEGIACLTGSGTCSAGEAASIIAVPVSEADLKARDDILQSHVFPRWVARCGDGCAAEWNESIGKVAGMTIQ
jgi:TRAP-type C4-dicarboxylate transport system substrate-binding protein